jgi:hypothetical protein
MPSAGFEPATSATKRPQTYSLLDRAATGICTHFSKLFQKTSFHFVKVAFLFISAQEYFANASRDTFAPVTRL